MEKMSRRSRRSVRWAAWCLGFVMAATACSSEVVETSTPASTVAAVSASDDDTSLDDGRRMVILDYSPTVSAQFSIIAMRGSRFSSGAISVVKNRSPA